MDDQDFNSLKTHVHDDERNHEIPKDWLNPPIYFVVLYRIPTCEFCFWRSQFSTSFLFFNKFQPSPLFPYPLHKSSFLSPSFNHHDFLRYFSASYFQFGAF